MSWDWDNLMQGSPGFRFNDNQNYLYDRDIMHKRNTEGEEREPLPSNWDEWGEFGDFTGLMEDVSLYPSSLGLFDRTILTRVQKRDQDKAQGEQNLKKREVSFSNDEARGSSHSRQPEVENSFISILPK